jgi:hypothetical protein
VQQNLRDVRGEIGPDLAADMRDDGAWGIRTTARDQPVIQSASEPQTRKLVKSPYSLINNSRSICELTSIRDPFGQSSKKLPSIRSWSLAVLRGLAGV